MTELLMRTAVVAVVAGVAVFAVLVLLDVALFFGIKSRIPQSSPESERGTNHV